MSFWFKRFKREAEAIDPHIRFKRVKLGFWRLYWKDSYLHEVFEEMPECGYDYEGYDPRIENQSYFEEFEDNAELIRKIKNYIEGYRDAMEHIKVRVFQHRHDHEFNENARKAYQQFVVK